MNWKTLINTLLFLSLNACALTTQADKLPSLSYCDLVTNPAQYDGQVVRVSARQNVGFEWSYLTDDPCAGGSSDPAKTWAITNDIPCEGGKLTTSALPGGYNRSAAMERQITIVGKFHNSKSGTRGDYPYTMESICLERADAWHLVH